MRFAVTPLQILVAAVPDAALRPLLIELLQNGAMPAAPLAPDGPSWGGQPSYMPLRLARKVAGSSCKDAIESREVPVAQALL